MFELLIPLADHWRHTVFASLTFVLVSQGFRHSPRHLRRSIHARVTEEKPNLVEVPESEPDSSSTLRKRKVKKRVPTEFYQSVQVTPTRKAVGIPPLNSKNGLILLTKLHFSPPFVSLHKDIRVESWLGLTGCRTWGRCLFKGTRPECAVERWSLHRACEIKKLLCRFS